MIKNGSSKGLLLEICEFSLLILHKSSICIKKCFDKKLIAIHCTSK